ncbi:hypothetical protein [Alkalimonas amylolytica]|uniref:WG containing repeat-containing protein n=1 Tax=Alkalimonas amylolytica TaxID=152573 RepID=A0A1H4FR54_ALKAM|nr:hypothetical protein [Alkalimonas amylolytica]SEA99863.1 hypothetical protein SAMN04488051_11263 [Alkalimonas amylolytica]
MRLICLMMLLVSVSAAGDKWGEPYLSSTISEDSTIIVRITPGNGFRHIEANTKHAVADVYLWNGATGYDFQRTVNLVNPAAPLEAFVDNNGYIITLDNWYQTGYGKAVVIYDPLGQIVTEIEVSELFPNKTEFNQLIKSVSSLHWRCLESKAYFLGEYFYVRHLLGGGIMFDYKQGSFRSYKPSSSETCKRW